MPAPTAAEKKRMNTYLRKHGLGSLDDPTILEQLAFFIRSHEKFLEVLMKVPAGAERANCYQALAPRIRFFKPKTLEQYELEGKQAAENLPVINTKTGVVTMPGDAQISETAKEAITGKTKAERDQAKLLERAENAIAEDLGQSKARGRLFVTCRKCQFGATVYAADRVDAFQTLIASGWIVSGDHTYCPNCTPTPQDEH